MFIWVFPYFILTKLEMRNYFARTSFDILASVNGTSDFSICAFKLLLKPIFIIQVFVTDDSCSL